MSGPAGAAEPTPATHDADEPGTTGTADPDSDAAGAAGALPGIDAASAGLRSTDPRVDDALSRLAEIDQLPLAEQVEVFSDIHRRLAAVLADPDSQAQ